MTAVLNFAQKASIEGSVGSTDAFMGSAPITISALAMIKVKRLWFLSAEIFIG